MDAFAYGPAPEMVAAGSGPPWPGARSSGDALGDLSGLRVETLVWLRFGPGAYLRDWLAGWLDLLVNGAEGRRRRGQRARFADFLRSCVAMLQPEPIAADRLEAVRQQLLLIELHSPEQAYFWLHMQEERVRETEPLRVR